MIEFFKANIGKKVADGNPAPLIAFLDGVLHDAREGSLTFKHVVKPEFVNPLGILHGGMASTFMDDVIGATVYSLNKPNYYVSLSLNVDFLSPAKLGEEIFVSAEVVRNGENIIHLESKIVNKDGRLIAKATSNMAKTKHQNLAHVPSKP
jgi:acyl-coenzyme A thioesterase 13